MLFVLFGQDEHNEFHKTYEYLDLKQEYGKFKEMPINLTETNFKHPMMFESQNNVYMFGGEVSTDATTLYKFRFEIHFGMLSIELVPVQRFPPTFGVPRFS